MKSLAALSSLGLAGCGAVPVLIDGRLANIAVGSLFALYAVVLARPRDLAALGTQARRPLRGPRRAP